MAQVPMTHRHEPHDLLSGMAESLGERGFFVANGFLGVELARAVRAQVGSVELKRAGIKRSAQLDDGVRTDEIAWLSSEESTGALAEAVKRFDALRLQVNELAWLGLRSFELQLAKYAPGAHYVRHRDAFPGQDNRRLTAIVYLNEGWAPRDGGELELFVEPEPLRVQPTLDRLVVFRSELVEHQVLEARAERWALTAWYSAM
ncbi:MAG: 2OG-Fe(II) oxygenase [Archangium sp.]